MSILSFAARPLDASNCIAMVKLIEDCIFVDDSYKIVTQISVTSRKAKDKINMVTIIINYI